MKVDLKHFPFIQSPQHIGTQLLYMFLPRISSRSFETFELTQEQFLSSIPVIPHTPEFKQKVRNEQVIIRQNLGRFHSVILSGPLEFVVFV